MSQTSDRFVVLDAQAYRHNLIAAIPHAKKRVVVCIMALLYSKDTDAIFSALKKAAGRGVHVHIIYDVFSHLPFIHGVQPPKQAKPLVQKTLRQLDELRALGVRVTRFGRLGVNIFKGRCHVKFTVIDNDVYAFGGVNFSFHSFEAADYMLHAEHADIADCLVQLSDKIAGQRPPLPNAEVPITATGSILFDGGKPGQSLIYNRACELAARSTNIVYVSQLIPNNRLARLIAATNHTIYSNSPYNLSMPYNISQAFDEQRFRLANSYRKRRYIHAKCMLFELQDGTKALLSGSHNFTYRGVALGTQEMTLYSTDAKLWQQLQRYIQEEIAN